MNVFLLHTDSKLCAQMHCDKHVVKMILESAQLLSTVNRYTGLDEGYKMTHLNHPCTKWASSGIDNWEWLKGLALDLAEEWRYRYDHTRLHKSEEVILSLSTPKLPDYGTPWPQVMPIEFQQDNTVEAYRAYYKADKAHLLTYTKRERPSWL